MLNTFGKTFIISVPSRKGSYYQKAHIKKPHRSPIKPVPEDGYVNTGYILF